MVIVDNTKKISLHQAASRASRHTVDAAIVQTIVASVRLDAKQTLVQLFFRVNTYLLYDADFELFGAKTTVNETF